MECLTDIQITQTTRSIDRDLIRSQSKLLNRQFDSSFPPPTKTNSKHTTSTISPPSTVGRMIQYLTNATYYIYSAIEHVDHSHHHTTGDYGHRLRMHANVFALATH